VPHLDRRGLLPRAIRYGRRRLAALREAGDLGVATLRSRRHRARLAGVVDHDLALPRRKRERRRRVSLPHPCSPGAGRVRTAQAFAHLAGVPLSTVEHRLQHLLRRGVAVEAMADRELIEHLTAPPADRRVVLQAALSDGTILAGGQRELVRRVLTDPALQHLRHARIGESGLRRRLRLLPHVPSRAQVLHALDLGPAPDE
jgi:hypothetical protein